MIVTRPIVKYCEMEPDIPYRCVSAPKSHPEWVGYHGLKIYWRYSTAARYQRLTFGEYLRALRIREGLSRLEVAEFVGVGMTTVRDWEIRGKIPQPETIDKLTSCLTRYRVGILQRLAQLDRLARSGKGEE